MSDIAQAVDKLHSARNHLQAALEHLRAAIGDAHQARMFRGLAFGDSEHELAVQSRGAESGAATELWGALLAIRDVEYDVGEYARLIAPGLSWSDAVESRPSPGGEGLLVDQERRPRTFREARHLIAKKHQDVVEVGRDMKTNMMSVEAALHKPEVTGTYSSTPRLEPTADVLNRPAVADVTTTFAMVAIIVIDVAERAFNWWRRKPRR